MNLSKTNLKLYGQLVIGPPGSGKTTYCRCMGEYLKKEFGPENVKHVNLDPGNDLLPFKVDIDVRHLITVEDVMERVKLGPNASLIYCMQFIDDNFEECLSNSIYDCFGNADPKKPCWILFDMPGQVELFTHVDSVKGIVKKLEKDMTLCTLNLVDSHYCSDPGKYISCLLTCLTTMLHISTPHVNILTKVDLAEKYGKLPFNLDYYTEVLDLSYLVDSMDEDERLKKYHSLNKAIAEVVENFGLVNFHPLDVQNESLVKKLAKVIDKTVGRIWAI